MKNKLFLLISLTLVIVLVLSFGCKTKTATEGEKQENNELRVAYSSNGYDYSFIVDLAEKKGFFKENGVKIKKVRTIKDTVALVMGGQADVMIQILASSVSAYLNNQDLVWIANTANYPTFNVVSRVPKEKIATAKSFAVARVGGSAHLVLYAALASAGVDPAKIKFISAAEDPPKVALLEKGQVDLAHLRSNTIRKLPKNKYYVIPAEKLFASTLAPRGIVTKKSFLKTKSKQIQGFVKAIYQALQLIRSDRKQALAFLKSEYKLSGKGASDVYNGWVKATDDLNFTPNKEMLLDTLPAIKKIAKPSNANKDLSGYIDTKFAEEAQK